MLNITATITHDLELDSTKYFIVPDMSIKAVTIKGFGMFLESGKPDEQVVIVEVEVEEGKKETGGAPIEDLFDTLELAEAALLTRTQANKKKEVDELKKLYTAIIERENAVASQLVALGINPDELVPTPVTAE